MGQIIRPKGVVRVPEHGPVLVSGRFEPDEQERIRAAATGARVEFVERLSDRPELLASATVIAGTPNREELAMASTVRWVHSWAAGVNNDLAAGLDVHPATLTSSHLKEVSWLMLISRGMLRLLCSKIKDLCFML